MASRLILSNYKPKRKNVHIWVNTLFISVLLFAGIASPFVIVIAFFLETIVVGFIQALKMIRIISYHNKQLPPKPKNNHYGMVLFFLFHYGFFIAVQLIFVFAILQIGNNHFDAFNLIGNLNHSMSMEGMKLVLASIIVFNAIDYYINFVSVKAYEKLTIDKVFMYPYKRIFVQQFAVIIGSFFIAFDIGMYVVAFLLIAIKAWMDLIFIVNPKKNIFTKSSKK